MLENVKDTGAYIHKWLSDIEFKSQKQIGNIRGRGTYLAFDILNLKNKSLDLYSHLKKNGINISIFLRF